MRRHTRDYSPGNAADEDSGDEEPFWTEAELVQMREDSERQYSELKDTLSQTSVKFGGFLAVYLLLTQSTDVCALKPIIGSGT